MAPRERETVGRTPSAVVGQPRAAGPHSKAARSDGTRGNGQDDERTQIVYRKCLPEKVLCPVASIGDRRTDPILAGEEGIGTGTEWSSGARTGRGRTQSRRARLLDCETKP